MNEKTKRNGWRATVYNERFNFVEFPSGLLRGGATAAGSADLLVLCTHVLGHSASKHT